MGGCVRDRARTGGARRGVRLKHTRFGMMREDGREMLGVREKRGGICKAALPAERMAGWAGMRDAALRGRHEGAAGAVGG